MSTKICPRCQKQNASANLNCFKCGKSLIYEPSYSSSALIRKEASPIKMTYVFERIFSSVLAACAVISIFYAVMALLQLPGFSILHL
jgi:uncharacterized membrane protein YvbJ